MKFIIKNFNVDLRQLKIVFMKIKKKIKLPRLN